MRSRCDLPSSLNRRIGFRAFRFLISSVINADNRSWSLGRTANFPPLKKVRKESPNEAAEATHGFGRPYKERLGELITYQS